ncbi:MAG: hypothetical protein AB1782_14060 [Cyanobacteriota bacterium]
MPKYIKNTYKDIDFLSDEGVHEYLEDELSNLPPEIMKHDVAMLLFSSLRNKKTLREIIELTKDVTWEILPYELQAIAVCLKLYKCK